MLNTFAKFLLMATSLSPVIGAVAVNQLARDEPWPQWAGWLVLAFLLVFLNWALLRYAARNAQRELVHIKEFERHDTEVLAFLLAYLLPFVSSKEVAFAGEWLTSAYVFSIIFLVFTHAGAFHFNPVMGMIGYHFYSVKNDEGVSHLLISRAELRRPGKNVQTVCIAPGIYLNTGGPDA